jgi:hypothetical protein
MQASLELGQAHCRGSRARDRSRHVLEELSTSVYPGCLTISVRISLKSVGHACLLSWVHSELAGPGEQCLYLPGTQGQCGSYVLEPCHQEHWASSYSQACGRNWDSEICLLISLHPMPETRAGGEEKYPTFPLSLAWCCLLKQEATAQVVTLLGQSCAPFPASGLVPFWSHS